MDWAVPVETSKIDKLFVKFWAIFCDPQHSLTIQIDTLLHFVPISVTFPQIWGLQIIFKGEKRISPWGDSWIAGEFKSRLNGKQQY